MIFKILVIILGLISSIFYAFFAAFRHDVDWTFNEDGELQVRVQSLFFSEQELKNYKFL